MVSFIIFSVSLHEYLDLTARAAKEGGSGGGSATTVIIFILVVVFQVRRK